MKLLHRVIAAFVQRSNEQWILEGTHIERWPRCARRSGHPVEKKGVLVKPGAIDTGRRVNQGLLLAAAAGVAVLMFFGWRVPSVWLQTLSPDGRLDPGTARYLDTLPAFLALLVALLLALSLFPSLRGVSAGSWRTEPPETTNATWLPWTTGLFAAVLRIGIAAFADIGLGDDGARVAWLEAWLQHPAAVWSGLWTPGHLYLHALANLVIRSPVWSGVVLSAVASGTTVGVLTRALERDWGTAAACSAGIAMSLLPVSLAHGSTPDVNPVFALFPVTALACVQCYSRRGLWVCLAGGCLLAGWATWCRYEAIALIPIISIMLWPRWRALALFVVCAMVPVVLWGVMESRSSGQVAHVAQAMQNDPAMGGSASSRMFSLMGSLWQAVPLPVFTLGLCGALRALKHRRGRSWMALGMMHLVALAGSVFALGAGIQPRYYILVGTIAAAYAGVAFGGMWRRDPRLALCFASLAAILFVIAPGLYPNEHDLWIRRDARLRALVDQVRIRADGRHVVWISGEAGYFYVCRVRPPIEFYHAMPRSDSDPRVVLDALSGDVVAVVQAEARARDRWQDLLGRLAPRYEIRATSTVGDYEIHEMIPRVGPGGG